MRLEYGLSMHMMVISLISRSPRVAFTVEMYASTNEALEFLIVMLNLLYRVDQIERS